MKYRLNKKLGQHFLYNKNILEKIMASIEILPEHDIIEIGPGAGSLTRYLVEQPVPVTAIEIDKRWADEIQQAYRKYSNFRLIHSDVMDINWLDSELSKNKLIVVGNLPYQLTSPILFRMIENIERISFCLFLIQKEVAERIVASSGTKKFGILSIAVQLHFDAEILFHVPSAAFIPPPKVVSSVIRLKKKKSYFPNLDRKKFLIFIHQLFNQRRKMIRNSIKSLLNRDGDYSEEISAYFTKRPEQLTIEELVDLYRAIVTQEVSYG